MTDNWAIQVSPRVGDTLINLRAATGDEMLAILSWYEQNTATIASALGAATAGGNVGAVFAGPGTGNVPPAPQQGSWGDQGSQQQAPPAFAQPAQQASPQGNGAPATMCAHGAMTYREGVGKKGPWRAYFCPTPKGTPNQCDPQFLR